MARNDITGDELVSKAASDAYLEGHERVFGNNKRMTQTIFVTYNGVYLDHIKDVAAFSTAFNQIEDLAFQSIPKVEARLKRSMEVQDLAPVTKSFDIDRALYIRLRLAAKEYGVDVNTFINYCVWTHAVGDNA